MMSSKLFTWCMVLFAIPTWADSQPNMPYDLNTSKYCTYWYDNYQGASCIQVASDWATKPADFARWNPTLTATCGGWLDGFSYCVEAYGEPGSTPRSSSTTIAQATTTVKPVVTSIPTWTAAGCYNDYTPPTLANAITLQVATGNTLMTIEACQKACWSGGWQFAGVELKTQCFCGNSISNEIAPDGNCKMPCGGNTAQLCGGQNRIFVYKGEVASTTTTTVSPSTTSIKPSSTSPLAVSKETWKPLGCYFDTGTPHSLLNKTTTPAEAQMTVNGCQTSCSLVGFSYAGLRYGKSCFCDNTVKTVPSNDNLCNIPCTGNSTQTCGGNDRINIYQQVILTPQYISLGCYVDAGTGKRTLRTFVNVFGGDSSNTNTACQSTCAGRGLPYSGTERGVECWCDSAVQSVAIYAPEGDAGCNTPCKGNTTQMCGGTQRMSVSYRVPF